MPKRVNQQSRSIAGSGKRLGLWLPSGKGGIAVGSKGRRRHSPPASGYYLSVASRWRRLCTPCRSVRAPSTAIWPQGRKRELFTDRALRASWRLVTRVLGLGHVLKARGHTGMLRAEGLLRDRQRPLVERLGLCVLALGAVEPCEVVQALGHIGMLRAKGFFPDRQRTFVERLGLRVLALGIVEHREVVQDCGHIGMLRAKGFFPDRQRTFV